MRSGLVVGLMSGTSLDGIDAVLLRIRGDGARTRVSQLAFAGMPFPAGLKKTILRNSDPSTAQVDEIARLNFLLAVLYADAVKKVARRARVPLRAIGLIGSHGQTIRHLPGSRRMFGKTIRATLQIGDPSVLATLTGIPTVGDFRVADMAAGGEGAPLVPYVDWLLFRSKTRNRILLNLGGIANVTILPGNCTEKQVRAFDTGPGNMMVDGLMRRYFGKDFDAGGAVASRGRVQPELLQWLMTHRYLKRPPPKSTGRELFGESLVDALVRKAGRSRPENIIATASLFTPLSVFESCRRFAPRGFKPHDLIVSGGGSFNRFFIETLRSLFGREIVRVSSEFGISPDAKEAIAFAILANETRAHRGGNLPSVTGASKRVVLGKLSDPLIGGRRRL